RRDAADARLEQNRHGHDRPEQHLGRRRRGRGHRSADGDGRPRGPLPGERRRTRLRLGDRAADADADGVSGGVLDPADRDARPRRPERPRPAGARRGAVRRRRIHRQLRQVVARRPELERELRAVGRRLARRPDVRLGGARTSLRLLLERRGADARDRQARRLRAGVAGLRHGCPGVALLHGHEIGRNEAMTKRLSLVATAILALALYGGSASADQAVHHPLYMPDAAHVGDPALQPPPVCCAPVGPPVAGEPAPVNMAYFGGHVQVKPKIYLVFWGWGVPGAFDHTTPGMPANDPDGAAARMTAFIKAMGGTAWAGSQTQYYETVNGQNVHIQN